MANEKCTQCNEYFLADYFNPTEHYGPTPTLCDYCNGKFNRKKIIDLKDVPDGITLKQHIDNLEQGKGIIHQIEDKKAPYGSIEDELTEEKLMSFLHDIMASPDAPKPMVMLTGCIEKGIVTQSSEQFNLCNNPDCKTCRNLEAALKEQFK